MGCNACSNMCSDDVKFEQVDMKISKKNCETLEKYGQGAAARREAKRVKEQYLEEIARKLVRIFLKSFNRAQKAQLPRRWETTIGLC